MSDPQKSANPEWQPRRGSGRSSRRRRAARQRKNYPICPLCQKPVQDLYSAITHRDSGTPAHFECVLESIRAANELAPSEKLCYLGGGSFGILQYRSAQGPLRFFIRKRIQYEAGESVPEWRRGLPRTRG